eukprot:6205166-Pleurochrysis_carterae.AAC.1
MPDATDAQRELWDLFGRCEAHVGERAGSEGLKHSYAGKDDEHHEVEAEHDPHDILGDLLAVLERARVVVLDKVVVDLGSASADKDADERELRAGREKIDVRPLPATDDQPLNKEERFPVVLGLDVLAVKEGDGARELGRLAVFDVLPARDEQRDEEDGHADWPHCDEEVGDGLDFVVLGGTALDVWRLAEKGARGALEGVVRVGGARPGGED